MAIRAVSLNRSLPLYSSVPSAKPSVQIQCDHSSPVLKHVSEDALAIATIVEAVSLANAAAEAAKDAVSSARALYRAEHDHVEEGRSTRARRKWRMRKRRGIDLHEDNDDVGRQLIGGRSSRSERSKYLTRKQEAEFSLCLKVAATLDAADASTAEMGRRNTDRAFLRARECRERIILSYKRLVISVATPYQGKGLSLQDLIQEGSIGLLQGAERFDHKKGYKLSTYTYWWIKQAIIKAVANKSSIVKSPGSLRGVMAKVIHAKSLLQSQLRRQPTNKEIADFLDLDATTVQLASARNGHPISIDRSVNDEGLTLKEIIPGPMEVTPEDMFTRRMISEMTDDLLATLTERERYVVMLHYGMNGEKARSCEEIGKLLKLSRERIRQIHLNALTKLRVAKSTVECFELNIV